ncbi:hypothetical protein CPLU01_00934 [Colletotrichum plurivorum]|uniref:Uncharacterized protein n=1 Tax=Colletotrichum plurivorum TaxID=2175906 RepID=A0A8H6NR13_9PEZI|nr:hypothetical protein CPLU01_00934 [Colletotrichum plurivorum]
MPVSRRLNDTSPPSPAHSFWRPYSPGPALNFVPLLRSLHIYPTPTRGQTAGSPDGGDLLILQRECVRAFASDDVYRLHVAWWIRPRRYKVRWAKTTPARSADRRTLELLNAASSAGHTAMVWRDRGVPEEGVKDTRTRPRAATGSKPHVLRSYDKAQYGASASASASDTLGE